ncbi:hypothetical protein EPN18_09730 [bacterium]|nr:MAG: hypothetical protein EPN18_09730 [bacterium]
MADLFEIEKLTKNYSDARVSLASQLNLLEARVRGIKNAQLPHIKTALAKTKEAEAKLKAAIEESPELFSRPKTQVFHGVKVGYQKLKGVISWSDADTVVRLILKHFSAMAETLTRTVVTPNKQALAELSAQDLKKLGVVVEETGDAVVIKPVDGDVEKVVNALLKDASGMEAA